MKKIMLALILAALAATTVFAQASQPNYNDPMRYYADQRISVKPQIAVRGAPQIDANGKESFPISKYKQTVYLAKDFHFDVNGSGFTRTISIQPNATFKVQVKDASGRLEMKEFQITSVTAVPLENMPNITFYKVVFLVPSNYTRVFITLDAVFKPDQAGEESENAPVLLMYDNDSKAVIQPVEPMQSSGNTNVVGNQNLRFGTGQQTGNNGQQTGNNGQQTGNGQQQTNNGGLRP